MDFTTWNHFNRKQVPMFRGVYILFLNREISKACKDDPRGVLYIGRTKNLYRRLRLSASEAIYRAPGLEARSLAFNHSTLTFLVAIGKDGQLRPNRELLDGGLLTEDDSFVLKYAATGRYCHEKKEKELLIGHVMQYGQLPPFNTKGPSLKHLWNYSEKSWKLLVKEYNTTIRKAFA